MKKAILPNNADKKPTDKNEGQNKTK